MASCPGQSSELQARQFLLKQGWKILSADISIAGVQVDILARDPQGIVHVVEVKSQGSLVRGGLKRAQFLRLVRVVEVLAEKLGRGEAVTLTLLVTDGPKVWLFAGEDLEMAY